MRNSPKLLATFHEEPYWYGILGWCVWEGELCVFQVQNLNNFSYKYILIHLCLHTCNTSQLLYVSNLPHFHCYDMWIESRLNEFLYFNPFLLLLGRPVPEIFPPVLSTLRGVQAIFTCNSEGFPLPNMVWMKQTGLGESEISASRVNVQINSHNGSSQLILQNTSTADSGYYICKASNYVSDTARAFLGVVCKLHLNM